MKNTKFIKRIEKISDLAYDFIKNNVKTVIVLATTDELDADENLIYDLPIVTTVNKYEQYDEWGVVKIENKNGVIILHTIGKGEDNREREFELEEISKYNACFLADLISEKL